MVMARALEPRASRARTGLRPCPATQAWTLGSVGDGRYMPGWWPAPADTRVVTPEAAVRSTAPLIFCRGE